MKQSKTLPKNRKRSRRRLQQLVGLLAYLERCARPLEKMLENFKGSRKYRKWWREELVLLNKNRTIVKSLIKDEQPNILAEPPAS